MKYIEVKIKTSQEHLDPLTCILMDMGIAGFAVEDPQDFQALMEKKNSYDWDYIDESLMNYESMEAGLTFYLDDTEDGRETLNQLAALFTDDAPAQEEQGSTKTQEKLGGTETQAASDDRVAPAAKMSWTVVDDSDWKDNWKEYFKPAKLTDRIVIKPSWEAYSAAKDELVIEIDPGMAFGTGTHPTTSLCIKLLEKCLETDLDSVIDVGCGSGILSIAAALLGAKDIAAVDIDPVAVEVTKENVELNGVSSKVRVYEGDLTKGLNEKAEIVVANLMADLVMMLSKDVAAHLTGKAIYISSGILIEKKQIVSAAIEACGFRILEILEEGEWCAIAASYR
ncbi:MAG: ribosomal protein methyltransferase [Bacillota bacterium]|jgi:ribosomal protein L11 methyltransferase|nr:ribosomal protein methyltransferase [Bacillota bacterium]